MTGGPEWAPLLAWWDLVPLVSQPPASATCVRQGQRWRVEYAHRRVLVPHCVGMLHLAVLLANPGQEIPALELGTGVAAVGAGAAGAAAREASAQPLLDREAVRRYRDRMSELRTQIDDFEAAGLTARAAEAGAELDWLAAQLAAATGIHGRPRGFPNDSERARLAVGKAVRRALAVITRADPRIGEHLTVSVRTGVRCSYRPG